MSSSLRDEGQLGDQVAVGVGFRQHPEHVGPLFQQAQQVQQARVSECLFHKRCLKSGGVGWGSDCVLRKGFSGSATGEAAQTGASPADQRVSSPKRGQKE